MTTGTNAEYTRRHNRRVITDALRQAGRLTRAELTRRTALTAQTVSNIMVELVAEGWVKEHPPEKAGRGQPPTPYSLNPAGGAAIGFHIEQHQIIAVVIDIAGEPLDRAHQAVHYPTLDDALPRMLEMIRRFRLRADLPPLLGVGIALPGPFGVEGMTAAGPTGLAGWGTREAIERVRTATGLPVLIENDAAAACMGERLFGVAGELHHFVHLLIGSGLGAGIHLDNHLYTGHRNNAGEIGHMVVVPDGKPCHCGNRGCLERHVSISALLEYMGLSADHILTEEDFRSPAGERGARQWLEEAMPAMRQAISILESLFDPQSIVISGLLPERLLGELLEGLAPLHHSISQRAERALPRVQAGTAGLDSVALGAGALVVLSQITPQYSTLLKAD
ncbi:ROK family transcriptional regulator [Salinicola aestuarinus]|uniref:ROK family transcriptional regulator n=1 Tax=Salinicola aestuarinus TaxID=1949082 RepID=UPI000DA1AA30|nr:ROK family transcriptional regulator [Salinicola aestuarinus]